MEQFLSILLYFMTGIGLLMTVSFWLSDIRLNGKRFRWYYYLPGAVLCVALGRLLPLVVTGWLYALSENNVWAVVLPIAYPVVIVGVIAGGFLLLRDREDFSASFYFSLCLFSLVVLSAWLQYLI